MNPLDQWLPDSSNLEAILKLNRPCDIEHLITKSLLDPVQKFFGNSGKNIRPQLVELGYRLSLENQPTSIPLEVQAKLQLASSIIELIHGGSLIVDDVQDNSEVRRNVPAFHLQHGIPIAINTGNWLYFWALDSVNKLHLAAPQNMALMNDMLSLMVRAHFGQALDIGTDILQISQNKVRETCFASMELKTGTLLALALRLGCAVADGNWQESRLNHLGSNLGMALQMFDDFGNFSQAPTSHPSKRHEDLYLKRPTLIWAVASELSPEDYENFISSVHALPCEEHLEQWMKQNDFHRKLWNKASGHLETVKAEWSVTSKTHPEAYKILGQIFDKLENSYVQKA
jgi:geranylgeranyl pyrophosphate synthase